jgi:hypothetical protein
MLTFSALREAPLPDGKPGPFSARRILAVLVFAPASILLFALAIEKAKADAGWTIFLPGGLCLAASLLLLFFTTWADITALVQTARGKAS